MPPRELYSLIDAAGFVVGLVLWDGVGELGAHVRRLKPVLAEGAQIGWTYRSGVFFNESDGRHD